jgi:hypothetical protein
MDWGFRIGWDGMVWDGWIDGWMDAMGGWLFIDGWYRYIRMLCAQDYHQSKVNRRKGGDGARVNGIYVCYAMLCELQYYC